MMHGPVNIKFKFPCFYILAYSPCFIQLETTDKLLSTTGYRMVYSVLIYCIWTVPCHDMHNLKNQCILTAIHLLRITCSIVRRCVGSMHSIPRINSLASWATFFHSGSGKSYCPVRIRFFMPGEMASPWLL